MNIIFHRVLGVETGIRTPQHDLTKSIASFTQTNRRYEEEIREMKQKHFRVNEIRGKIIPSVHETNQTLRY